MFFQNQNDHDIQSKPDFNFFTMKQRNMLPPAIFRVIPLIGLLVGGLISAYFKFSLVYDCLFGALIGFLAYQFMAHKKFK